MNRVPTLAAALVVALLLTSCRDGDVVSYRVAKESPPDTSASHAGHAHAAAAPAAAAGASDAAMANSPVATAAGPGLTWTAPAGWQAKAGSAVRKATFAIVGENGAAADLAVTAFPGDVGGEVANVNRWRGQIALPPVSDAEVAQGITRLAHNGLEIAVVDLSDPAGKSSTRLIGAMVPYNDATWFFKLVGPDALLAREKPAFLQFLSTVQPAALTTASAPTP